MNEILIISELLNEIIKYRKIESEAPSVTKPSHNDEIHQKEAYIQAKVYFWKNSARMLQIFLD